MHRTGRVKYNALMLCASRVGALKRRGLEPPYELWLVLKIDQWTGLYMGEHWLLFHSSVQ